jgi:hypothetical protein
MESLAYIYGRIVMIPLLRKREKKIRTFKNIPILLALLFTIIILSLSLISCQEKPRTVKSQLTEIGFKILEKKERIEFVRKKLLSMEMKGRVEKHLSDDTLHIIQSVINDLSIITILLGYEAESIIALPHIMDEYRSRFSELRVTKVRVAIEQIRTSQKYLSWAYRGSPYKLTLRSVGNPTINIQTALELLEQVQLLITPKSKKQSGK